VEDEDTAEDLSVKVKLEVSEPARREGEPERELDIHRARRLLQAMAPDLIRVLELGNRIDEIVVFNQNRGSGGDLRMSLEEWVALQSFADAARQMRNAGKALASAPSSPMLCDMAPGATSRDDSDIPF
jgi:hypothetical protein